MKVSKLSGEVGGMEEEIRPHDSMLHKKNVIIINRKEANYPWGIWFGFWRSPLIRNFHEPIKVFKHVYSKNMWSIQLVCICLLLCKFSFLWEQAMINWNENQLSTHKLLLNELHTDARICLLRKRVTNNSSDSLTSLTLLNSTMTSGSNHLVF